jgi:hypothetical protein
MPLPNIAITRYEEDPQAQGVVRPDTDRWQLVIDKDGYPHLYVQVNVEDDDGKAVKGLLCLDDMLPDGLSIKGLMDEGSFGGKLSVEDETAAVAEYQSDRQIRGIPCPR